MPFSAKPDDPRSQRGRPVPDASQTWRRGHAHRAAGRPDTGNRRAAKPEPVAGPAGARIIYLTWADTFGRPARARLPGMTARVLPFRRP